MMAKSHIWIRGSCARLLARVSHSQWASQEAVAFHGVWGCTLFLLALAHTCFLSAVHAGFLRVHVSIHLGSAYQPLGAFLLYCERCCRRLVPIDQVRSGPSETGPALC